MASFKSHFLILAFLLASQIIQLSAVTAARSVEEVAAHPPLSDANIPFLAKCDKIVTDKCGRDIEAYIYTNGPVVSKDCCNDLVKAGLSCHKQFLEYTRAFHPNADPSQVSAKSKELCEACGLISPKINNVV